MKFLVQKFGGTSLATPELREKVVDKIIAAREEGYTPVVVVSAIGRKGEPYATDSLLSFARQVNNDLPARELDLLLSCGEIISGVILTAHLQKNGYRAVFLTGAQAGIITDNAHGEARILKVQPHKVVELAREGNIVVVAGFQGSSENGEITTLGRGGSDTTAAALGVALDAICVDICTDVEGIMTADPRIVEEAKTLEAITYDEICHLAQEGAKVIHPRAVEIASQKNIPLRVRSIFTDSPGTLVTNSGEVYRGTIDITRDRLITGIAQIPDICQFKINIGNGPECMEHMERLLRGVALAGISIDFVNVLPGMVLFTVKEELADKTARVLENMGFTAHVEQGCAKVSCVGAAMTGVPGVIADIVEALAGENIQILQCNDSHTTVWVLVKGEDMEKAVRALHRQFLRA